VLNCMGDYCGPARPVDKIDITDLLEFMQTIDDRPNVSSPATYNKYVKTIRTFFTWCIATGYIEKSPASALTRRRQKDQAERVKAMPDHLYYRLLDFSKWQPRNLALCLFLGDTGCRIGGAAKLRWADTSMFNKKNSTMSWAYEQYGPRWAFVTEKNSPDPRPVTFSEAAERALMKWHFKQAPEDPRKYVFSVNGAFMAAEYLGQHFRRIAKKAGAGSWGPHSLRHRKGFQLSDSKTPPQMAALIFGDTVEEMIRSYYPKDWTRAAQYAQALHFQGFDDVPKVLYLDKTEEVS
jgi:integrase